MKQLNADLLKELAAITDEEQAILDGCSEINRDIYMTGNAPVINAKKLLDSGKLITIRPHTRFVHFPEHTHDYVELVFMCSGSTTHIVNGRTITLNAGELLFLGQNAKQEIMPAGLGDVAVNFIILPDFFENSLLMLGEEPTPLRNFVLSCLSKDSGGYLHFKVSDVLPIQNIMENLLWTLRNDMPNKRNINQTTMGLLFILLLNHTDRLAYENDQQEIVFRVMRYIESNYRSGSLEDCAAHLYCDYYWLSREIKKKTGKTYIELVQDRRLSQAAFLLKNTRMSVACIAHSVGYENISFFHRLFSVRFGMSPKEMRGK